jgi:hypothetical protein
MSNEIINNDNLGSQNEIIFVMERIAVDGVKQSDIEKHCLNNKNFFECLLLE